MGRIYKRLLSSRFIFLFLTAFIFLSAFLFSNSLHPIQGSAYRYFNAADEAIILKQYDKAITNYLKGIEYAGKKEIPLVWDDLGYAFLQKRELEKAIDYLKNALSAFPVNINPHLYLAAAYFLNDEVELASKLLERIEKNICFDESWIKIISKSMIRKFGLYGIDSHSVSEDEVKRLSKEKGIFVLKKQQDQSPKSLVYISIDAFDERNEGVFYFLQGLVYKKSGDSKNAEKKLIAALKANYDEREVRSQLFDLYQKTNQSMKAREQSEQIEEMGKEINTNVGLKIHHRLKEHKNNLLLPFHEKFLKELEKGNIDDAIQILEKALDINEQSFEINHNLALLYFDMRDLAKAEAFCARAIWFKEDHPGCHDLMGNIYFHQRAYKEAIWEFERMLEIDKQNAHAHYNLGTVYYILRNWTDAEKYWKKAIEYEEKMKRGRKEKVTMEKGLEYSLTVRKMPTSFLSHKSLGKMYSEQGRIQEAITEFEEAVKLKESEAEVYLALANAYFQKKGIQTQEIKKAVSYLEKYLYLGGKEEGEARKLLEQLKKKLDSLEV